MSDTFSYVEAYLEKLKVQNALIEEQIDRLDTTALSPSCFRMVNSRVFWILEYQNLARDTKMDWIYRRGITILSELFSNSDRAVLFLPIDKWILGLNDIKAIMAEWNKYFYNFYREKFSKKELTLRIRYKYGHFFFMLIKVGCKDK